MDSSIEKLSIKNLLFTKAIPNYAIPFPVDGYKIYSCTDCGDKFMFESSYEHHINRKSVLITYMCRYCGQTKMFYNRCRLLFHIRSHSFKTATINVQDLKVDPVPLGLYKQYITSPIQAKKPTQQISEALRKSLVNCFECKKALTSVGMPHKDRAAHFMQYTNEVYSCPVCLFTLPTLCGLRAHIRFHLKFAPYYCPECGVGIINKNVHYPFNHDCEGFKMMRATARLKCPVPQCQLFHPNDFTEHMKDTHIKKVLKCPLCVVACFNEPTMQKHLKSHTTNAECKALIFYQCELCPGRLVLQNHIDNHLRTHVHATVFPCWTCGMAFKEVFALIDHHIKKHDQLSDFVKSTLNSIIRASENQHGKAYRVVKRCDQCKKTFTYKCKYNDISILPNECPNKCTSKLRSSVASHDTEKYIKCNMCDTKIPYNWKEIKKHYAREHKNHRCLDPKVIVNKMDIRKYLPQNQKKISKRNRKKRRQLKPPIEEIVPTSTTTMSTEAILGRCGMCGHNCETKEMLETHLISHRDPCMAYQCLECGQSFIVKPSFSKHLVLEHGICDSEEYIKNKQCYNENALDKHQNSDTTLEPLKENQCKICRDQFENSDDLEKHFRVHGMAFLLKNTYKSNEKTSKSSNKDSANELNKNNGNKNSSNIDIEGNQNNVEHSNTMDN